MIIKLLFKLHKFMYLHLMDEYKRTDARNYIANVIKRLKDNNEDGSRDEEIADNVEMYKWMCVNRRNL